MTANITEREKSRHHVSNDACVNQTKKKKKYNKETKTEFA